MNHQRTGTLHVESVKLFDNIKPSMAIYKVRNECNHFKINNMVQIF
jgi:hypothetical protein